MPQFDVIGALFDMDGLLLDTERVGMHVLRDVIAPYGHTTAQSDAIYLGLVGTSQEYTAAALRRAAPSVDPAELEAIWHARVDAIMAGGVPLRPTVAESLDALSADCVPMAVVTTTRTARARQHLEKAGLLHHFADVIGRDRVAAPKPDPAPYLAGAAALGLAPAQCAAFEDSDTGTRAAVGAGCRTWQIPDLRPDASALPDLGQSVASSLNEALRDAGLLGDT
ncbi:MAG: HAD family phosphatase [Pseudomonadota bacterium]